MRAWQAAASRYMGLQHVVLPNAFALQLPHAQAYSRGEAALPNYRAVRRWGGGAGGRMWV